MVAFVLWNQFELLHVWRPCQDTSRLDFQNSNQSNERAPWVPMTAGAQPTRSPVAAHDTVWLQVTASWLSASQDHNMGLAVERTSSWWHVHRKCDRCGMCFQLSLRWPNGSRPRATLDHLGDTNSAFACAHSTPERPSYTCAFIHVLRPSNDSSSVVQTITVSAASFFR